MFLSNSDTPYNRETTLIKRIKNITLFLVLSFKPELKKPIHYKGLISEFILTVVIKSLDSYIYKRRQSFQRIY